MGNAGCVDATHLQSTSFVLNLDDDCPSFRPTDTASAINLSIVSLSGLSAQLFSSA